MAERLLLLLMAALFALGGQCGPALWPRVFGVPEAAGVTRLADVSTGVVIAGGLVSGQCVRLTVSEDDTWYIDPAGHLLPVANLSLCWEDSADPERGVNCGPPPEPGGEIACSSVVDAR